MTFNVVRFKRDIGWLCLLSVPFIIGYLLSVCGFRLLLKSFVTVGSPIEFLVLNTFLIGMLIYCLIGIIYVVGVTIRDRWFT